MIDRRDFIIAALVGVMLVVTLYPQVTSSASEYDPWLDYNDDGKIRIDDILSIALAYGSDGDPTKNVTVTNWHEREPVWKVVTIVEDFNLTWNTEFGSDWVTADEINWDVSIAGYSRIILYAKISNYTDVGGDTASPNNAQVSCRFTQVWDFGEKYFTGIYYEWNSVNPTIAQPFRTEPAGSNYMETTVAPVIKVTVQAASRTQATPYPSSISCLISIGIYLRND